MPGLGGGLYGEDPVYAPEFGTRARTDVGIDTGGTSEPASSSGAAVPARTRPDNVDVLPTEPTTTPVTGLPGSPLNTLYGVDNESYLTEDQRKLMRQIQGKFDASLDRRDRELARYGAPQLSSFVEDEALARAIAGAQALNYRDPVTGEVTKPVLPPWYGGGGGSSGGGNLPRPSTVTPPERSPTGAQTNAEWQRIMTGLASVAPLLFGKNAWGEFMNKGLIQTAKEAIWGKDVAPSISDLQFEAVVRQYGNPYGSTSGWGQDLLQPGTGVYAPPTLPGWEGGDWGPIDTSNWWEGGDWGVPDTSNWWDFLGGSGGDYVDYFGGV